MTIYMSTGNEYVIDVNDIDTINFTLTPPPTTMNIYGSSGDLFLLVSEIDSIEYTISVLQGVDIQTKAVDLISNFSATSGGIILNDGGYTFIEKGILWGEDPLPVLGLNYVVDNSGLYDYTGTLQNLSPGTTYYVRSYAYAAEGIAYGPVLSFQTTNLSTNHLNPAVSYGVLEDIDGNIYNTVVIGDQVWMAENLRTTRYANGDPIPQLTNATNWSNTLTGAWSNYNNMPSYNYPLGKLYNGYAILDDREVCPTGWRLPREFEYTILDNYYSGTSGAALKSLDNSYWQSVGQNVTNVSGFSALGSGYRMSGLDFTDLGSTAQFWTRTYTYDTISFTGLLDTSLHYVELWQSSDYMFNYIMNDYTVGRAVRCIRKLDGLDEVQETFVTSITSTSADFSSSLFNTPIGSTPIVGFVWGTDPDPILSTNDLPASLTGLNFGAQLTGLLPNTRYYVRAYSINSNGTDYGRVVNFITPL
jgi:uncharacterized protein (TIGR02145 family)